MNKLNLPEEIDFRHEDYSCRSDMKVNGWMLVALIISCASDVFFSEQIKTMQPVWRAIIAIAPFPALLVWVRDLRLWVNGMDELHRRITLTAIVFSVGATLFVVALWHLLARSGIWQMFFHTFFDPTCIWVILSLMTVFYFRGYTIFNRRYK